MTPQQHGRHRPLSFPIADLYIGIDSHAYLGHGYAQWFPIINSRHTVCHLFTSVERHRRVAPNVVRQRGTRLDTDGVISDRSGSPTVDDALV